MTTKTKLVGTRALLSMALMGLAVAAPQAANAQFSDSFKFLESVRKSDSAAVIKAIEQPGVTPINTKDRSTGETALHIALARRDLIWTSYFLKHGARVDLTDNQGRTPLMTAVEKRFQEGVAALLANKANPNQTNSSGETALIRAVQIGETDIGRLLLNAGADPNRRDTISGMSALDYAKRDNRVPGLIEQMSAKAKSAPGKGVQGPQL